MVKYQGNKSKYASNICSKIRSISLDLPFYDICCGAGEITAYMAKPTVMIDSGPWGWFWRGVKQEQEEGKGAGCGHDWSQGLILESELIASNYKYELRRILKNEAPIKGSFKWCAYFLALQQEAFNGKAVECNGGLWKHPGFGKAFSKNFYLKAAQRAMKVKIRSAHVLDASDYKVPEVAAVYVDPDYEGTTGYADRTLDVQSFVNNNRHCDLFVSHHTVLDGISWDSVHNVSVARAGREGRTSVDETELLHILRKTK